MKQAILWLITAILGLYSLYYALFCHFHFGNLCVWLLTAASLVYALFWRRVDAFLAHGVGLVFRWVLVAGAVLFAAGLGMILAGQFGGRAAGGEKTLVVLGCAVNNDAPSPVLTCRLQAAYAYYTQHPDVTIVVCGGQGPQESDAEGRVMARWLESRGVPAAQILTDDTSTSTEENFRNARALLEQQGISVQEPIAYVTNGFHCFRAGLYARRAGFAQAGAVPAELPPGQYLTCYIREVFALLYYWVFKSPERGFLKEYVGVLTAGLRRF